MEVMDVMEEEEEEKGGGVLRIGREQMFWGTHYLPLFTSFPHPPGLVICRPHLTSGFLRLLGERRVETPTYKHLFKGKEKGK